MLSAVQTALHWPTVISEGEGRVLFSDGECCCERLVGRPPNLGRSPRLDSLRTASFNTIPSLPTHPIRPTCPSSSMHPGSSPRLQDFRSPICSLNEAACNIDTV